MPHFFRAAALFTLVAFPAARAQVALVADLAPGAASSSPSALAATADTLYFSADADNAGYALWRYVPATGLPERVPGLALDDDHLLVGPILPHANRLYVTTLALIDGGSTATALWALDPTSGEAALVDDEISPYVTPFLFDGRVHFVDRSEEGWGLNAFDPATGAVEAVRADPFGASPAEFTAYGGRLFFRTAPDGHSSDHELWVFDPATGEVAEAADLRSDGGSYPTGLTVYADRLYFTANADGEGSGELWSYDAVTGEASLAAEIAPGPLVSQPRALTVYDGRLFFFASSEGYERELWFFDAAVGTADRAATLGVFSLDLGGMAVYDERLFFALPSNGLWMHDVATGTTAEVDPSVQPRELVPFAGRLFFAGSNDDHGAELWAYSSPLATPTAPTHAPNAVGLSAPYPNPTRGVATLTLTLGAPQHVRLTVHDALGREAAVLHDGMLQASKHTYHLDGEALPNGTYFVRATGDAFTATRRVTVVR